MTTRTILETAHLQENECINVASERCYPIAPMGYGNELSEGLASYFVRLCAAHKLKPNDLLRSGQFFREGENGTGFYRRKHLATANGVGPVARQVVNRLSSLTGNEDLIYLTALPWAGMLDPKGNHLLKDVRAWCPICYEQAVKAGTPVFDPLYTSFRIVSLCARHLTPLCNRCPKCGATQPFVPNLPFLEYCSKCGHHLGIPQDYSGLERRTRVRADVWFSNSTANLIKATIHYQDPVTLDTFSGKLNRILRTHAGGKPSVLAKQLGLPTHHFVNWLRKGYKPAFPLFLDLCRRLNCPPSSFLFESDELTHPDFWIKEKPKVYVYRKRRSEREVQLLGTVIKEIAENTSAPPRSLKRIAKELECSPYYLANRFPDEAAQIRSSFSAYRNAESGRRKVEREMRIRLAFQTAISNGISTSDRSLKIHRLITARDTRHPEYSAIKTKMIGHS